MKNRQNYVKNKIRGLKPKKSIFKKPVFWLVLLVCVITTTGCWGVVFYSQVQITGLEISGNEKITSTEIESIVWPAATWQLFLGISSKSIFLADTKAASAGLLQAFPRLGEAVVVRSFPNGLLVRVRERQSVAAFCQQEACFSIDEKGIMFEQLPARPQMMVITKEGDNKSISLGQQAVDTSTVTDMVKIQKNLKDNFGVDVKDAVAANPLVVKTSEGWKIYFDSAQNIDLQITKMNLLLKDKISTAERKKLQYIYLQYKDRAYYK